MSNLVLEADDPESGGTEGPSDGNLTLARQGKEQVFIASYAVTYSARSFNS